MVLIAQVDDGMPDPEDIDTVADRLADELNGELMTLRADGVVIRSECDVLWELP